ncbi:MAG: hypothetical protein KGD64_10420 [Candidatus Heimdallarchaeota archaeon]|nr:hypothetical protein [Candidatus Heimdallarchaeota archaeon]
MGKYVLDTNFFISGFQAQPTKFQEFATLFDELNLDIYITHHIKSEMRFFLQREILPYITVEPVNNKDFQKFLDKLHSQTTDLPQKADLSVIYAASKISATIVSSDLKLLETAELLGIKTLTNSSFLKRLIEENEDSSLEPFLKELDSKLFVAEIRYSVESTNRYDPVKRIKKILDSAIAVIRTEYEEKLTQQAAVKLKESDGFSLESIQLHELLIEIGKDMIHLEKDFVQGKYVELEDELLSRVREITDHLVDWKLAVDKIEDQNLYDEALLLLGRLQYLACICLIENKKIDLARVYMDKIMMILFQNKKSTEEYGTDVHFLRMIILLLSGQIHRLNSYFTPAFEAECTQYKRTDVANVVRALILLTVILKREKVEESSTIEGYDNIEFINQLGFKFMQLGNLNKASLMFEQTFYLSLNGENKGMCIASIEYLSWLFFAGLAHLKSHIQTIYGVFVKKYPVIKDSYKVNLELTSRPKDLEKYEVKDFKEISSMPTEYKSSLYCIGTSQMAVKGKMIPIIRVMNWEINARIAIVDETNELSPKASLGTSLHLLEGKFRVNKASSHFKKQYNVELILQIDPLSEQTIVFRNPGGWELSVMESQESLENS